MTTYLQMSGTESEPVVCFSYCYVTQVTAGLREQGLHVFVIFLCVYGKDFKVRWAVSIFQCLFFNNIFNSIKIIFQSRSILYFASTSIRFSANFRHIFYQFRNVLYALNVYTLAVTYFFSLFISNCIFI